jgi:hypothetical protein
MNNRTSSLTLPRVQRPREPETHDTRTGGWLGLRAVMRNPIATLREWFRPAEDEKRLSVAEKLARVWAHPRWEAIRLVLMSEVVDGLTPEPLIEDVVHETLLEHIKAHGDDVDAQGGAEAFIAAVLPRLKRVRERLKKRRKRDPAPITDAVADALADGAPSVEDALVAREYQEFCDEVLLYLTEEVSDRPAAALYVKAALADRDPLAALRDELRLTPEETYVEAKHVTRTGRRIREEVEQGIYLRKGEDPNEDFEEEES